MNTSDYARRLPLAQARLARFPAGEMRLAALDALIDEEREIDELREALRFISHAGGDEISIAEIPFVLAGVRGLAGAMLSLDSKHGKEALTRMRDLSTFAEQAR